MQAWLVGRGRHERVGCSCCFQTFGLISISRHVFIMSISGRQHSVIGPMDAPTKGNGPMVKRMDME
jgi:hypothetical protein